MRISQEGKEARVARLLSMKNDKHMTLAQIAAAENTSRQNISRLIGPTRTTPNPILLKVHAFIRQYEQEHKFAPSIPEIAKEFPTDQGKPRSASVIAYWLNQMEELKLIHKRTRGVARSLRSRPLPSTKIVMDMQEKG